MTDISGVTHVVVAPLLAQIKAGGGTTQHLAPAGPAKAGIGQLATIEGTIVPSADTHLWPGKDAPEGTRPGALVVKE